MKGQAEPFGHVPAEIAIRIGFGAAQAVMQVSDVEDQAKFAAPFGQQVQQRYRVGAARKPNRKPEAGAQQRSVERDRG